MPKVDVQDPVKLERFAQLERESGPYIGYPNVKKHTAPQGDVNALPDPRTYAAVSGFLGTPTEEQGFSVLHPDIKNIRTAGDIGYGAGIAANLLPALGPAVKGTARLAGQALSDASMGQGYKALQNVVPQPMFAVPPSSSKPTYGKGWWYNSSNKQLHEIPHGDLGPHGDHDGWISVGDNAKKLGVDPKVASAWQEANYGFMLPKEKVQLGIKTGEINPKEHYIDPTGDMYYNPSHGNRLNIAEQHYYDKHSMPIENYEMTPPPKELENLVRIRQWPSGNVSFNLSGDVNDNILKGISSAVDKIPSLWRAPRISVYTEADNPFHLTPENFSKLKTTRDLKRFNDPSLPSASNVKDFNFETKPTTAPPSTPITTEQYNANLANFLKNSKEKDFWYHGTASDVKEFKPELGLEKPNQAGAAFFSKSPEYSGNKYAVDAPIYLAKEAHKYLTPEQMSLAQKNAKQYFKDTYADMPEHANSMIKSIEEGKPVGEAEDQLIAEYQKHLPSGPNVIKAHLNVENPFDPAVPEHVEALKAFNPKLDPKLTDRIGVTAVLEHPDIQAAIKGSGFDSFYTNEDGYRNIGVFDPTRIKSAIGNEGTFDPTNPIITKKDGGSVTVEDPVLIERKLKLMGLI